MDSASLDSGNLFHLATEAEWTRYEDRGWIEPPSLLSEGFVHCSWGHQVSGTVKRHFAGVSGLLALRIDPAALAPAKLVEEDSYQTGMEFPHVYGPIATGAVRAVVRL